MKTIILAVALFLVGCGSQDHAGGSGMEIPNSFTMIAMHGNGALVKNGHVRIVSDSKWMYYVQSGQSVVLDSMVTDSRGSFSFYLPNDERVRIEIVSGGEGVSVVFDSTRTTVSLEALGTIQGQWKSGATVKIIGTSFSQEAEQNGNVNFYGIPSIQSGLISLEEGQPPVVLSSAILNSNDTLQLGELERISGRLLIDDFEKLSRSSYLDPYVHGSSWFSIADENEGGNSTVYPSTANGNSWLLAISDSGALNGNSLTIQYQVKPSTSSDSYAIFGCKLGNGINAGAIDSIRFSASTNGHFVLTNGSQTLINGVPTTAFEWNTYTIHRQDLDSLEINPKIKLLQFVITDTTGSVFKLDDFAIYGDPFELLVNE